MQDDLKFEKLLVEDLYLLNELYPKFSILDLIFKDQIFSNIEKLLKYEFNPLFKVILNEKVYAIIIGGFDAYRGKLYYLGVVDPGLEELILQTLDFFCQHLKKYNCQRVNALVHKNLDYSFLLASQFSKVDYSLTFLNLINPENLNLDEDLLLKKISINDYEIVQDFLKKTGSYSGAADNPEGFVCMSKHETTSGFLAYQDKKLIGIVWAASDGALATVWHLAIDPDLRSLGYGSRIYHAILVFYQNLTINTALIFVLKSNLRAHKFWQNLGFVPILDHTVYCRDL